MDLLRRLVCYLLFAYYIVLIARIVLSWVPALPEPVRPLARAVRAVTDPLLDPLRRMLPPMRLGNVGALDFSPLVLFFGIIILQGIIC